MLHGRFVHVGKTNRFANLGCELQHNVFGGRAPSTPAEGAMQFFLLHSLTPLTLPPCS